MSTAVHVALLLAACTNDDPTPPPASGPVTWHADVRPLIERSCLDCHGDAGLAPLDLRWRPEDGATGVPPWSAAAVAAVAERRMPPWPARDACHPIAGSRALSAEEVATFTTWRDQDYPEGDPADFAPLANPPGRSPVGEPTIVLGFDAPYTPPRSIPDDYRCMTVGPAFDTETWVNAVRVVPDQQPIVHHVLAYLVAPEFVANVEAADAADPLPGYACWGGPVPGDTGGGAAVLASYVPGALPEVLPDAMARPVPPGARVVLQMHYNVNALAPGEPAPADSTALELWTRDTPPVELVLTTGIADYDFLIPSGAAAYSTAVTQSFGASVRIISAVGHMHQLGTLLTLDVEHADGSADCLLDIPRWDFDWQMTYTFKEDAPFWLSTSDVVRLTCAWDNTAAHQPVVNGEQLEPRDVRWGEGSTDEMCLAYASYTVPAPGAEGCDAIVDCHGEACAEGDGACVATCWERSLSACGLCVASGVLACGADACQLPGLALASCVDTSCAALDLTACLAGPCRAPLVDYLDCQDPNVRDGTCDEHFETCGVSFAP